MKKFGLKEGESIDHPWINKALERAQQRVEARNFDIRKTLLKFDDDTKLEELIETMFVWAMKQPNRKVKDMEYEITEGIYDYWKN